MPKSTRLLTQLKEETRSVHDSLESRLNLLAEEFGIEHYVETLKAFYGFYVSFEKNISRHRILMDFDYVNKVLRLSDDLIFFGVNPEEIPLFSMDQFRSPEELVGALYVMEGSGLGGMVLSVHFSKKFSLSPGFGLSFFYGIGKETVTHWQNFQNAMESEYQKGQWDKKRVIDSAKKTFFDLGSWLLKGKS